VLLALEETENALVSLSRERRRSCISRSRSSAAEAVQLARQRYRMGFADYLSVLDAERNFAELAEQLVHANVDGYPVDAVYKALGGVCRFGVSPRFNEVQCGSVLVIFGLTLGGLEILRRIP